MATNGVEIITVEGVQKITLNNPHTKNAISQEVYKSVTEALNSSADNDSVLFTVITGDGEYFSSGTSLLVDSRGDDVNLIIEASLVVIENFISALIDYPKLLVAVVNGPAIGIAVTILGLCDIVFASDTATFQTPFIKLGLCPEVCSSFTFPRIMGYAKAGQMLYCGYKMKAEEACECGLVSNIFEHSKLSEVFQKVQKIRELPIQSLMCTKKLIRRWDREQLHKVRKEECAQLAERFKSDDFMMALINFANKRSKL